MDSPREKRSSKKVKEESSSDSPSTRSESSPERGLSRKRSSRSRSSSPSRYNRYKSHHNSSRRPFYRFSSGPRFPSYRRHNNRFHHHRGGGGGYRNKGPRFYERNYRSHYGYPLDRDSVPNKCIGVFGLNNVTEEFDLREVFETFGPINECKLVLDSFTKRSRCFAFVYFDNVQSAMEARKAGLKGLYIHGRKVRVDYSHYHEKPQRRTPENSPPPRSTRRYHDRSASPARRSRSPRPKSRSPIPMAETYRA